MKILKLLPLLCIVLISCGRKYETIGYGKDACAHCRMTIIDARFAAELITGKGRVYKFDDIRCMKQYMNNLPEDERRLLFIHDYLTGEQPLDATRAVYIRHESFSSPMNGDYAAFASVEDAKSFKDSLGTSPLNWEKVD